MKKRLGLLVLTIAMLLMVSACSKNYTAELKMTESFWSGLDRNSDPKEIEGVYNIKVGDKITSKDKRGFEIEIKSIDKGSVTFTTNSSMSDSSKGIYLKSDKKEFTVKLTEKLKLVTPTPDQGFTYDFELTKIEESK